MHNSSKSINNVLLNLRNNIFFYSTKVKISKTKILLQNWPMFLWQKQKTLYFVFLIIKNTKFWFWLDREIRKKNVCALNYSVENVQLSDANRTPKERKNYSFLDVEFASLASISLPKIWIAWNFCLRLQRYIWTVIEKTFPYIYWTSTIVKFFIYIFVLD